MALRVPRFGYDVFISYSRGDGQIYAQNLFTALSDEGLAPFIDAVGTSPGQKTPAAVLRRLRASSMLVVIASPAAAMSPNIAEEIELFAKTGRNMVIIDVDAAATDAMWRPHIEGLPLQVEASPALRLGEPNPEVVAFVLSSATFTRRAVQLRRGVLGAAAVAAGLVIGGTFLASAIIGDAQEEADNIRLLAQASTTRDADPFRAVCALAAMTRFDQIPGARQQALEALQAAPALAQAHFHSAMVTHLSFDPSGTWLLSASNDATAHLWNWRSNERVLLEGHDVDIRLAAHSRDGARIVTVDTYGLAILRTGTGRELSRTNLEGWVKSATFSRAADQFYIADPQGGLRVYGIDALEDYTVLNTGPADLVAMDWATEDVLVTATSSGQLAAWNMADGQTNLWTKDISRFSSFNVSFGADLGGVVTEDGTTHLFDVMTGKLVGGDLNLSSGSTVVLHPTAPEGFWMGRSGQLHALRFEDPSSDPAPQNYARLVGTVEGTTLLADYSQDGAFAIMSGSGRNVSFVPSHGDSLPRLLRGHQSSIFALATTPDAQVIASGATDGEIRIWHRDAPAAPRVHTTQGLWSVVAAFSPDGTLYAAGEDNGGLSLWDTQTGALLWSLPDQGGTDRRGWLRSVRFTTDGTRLITASDDGQTRVIDARTGTIAHIISPKNGRQIFADIAASNRLVTVGRTRNSASLWDLENAKAPLAWLDHDSHVNQAAFSPDETTILTASSDGTIRNWSAEDGASIAPPFVAPDRSHIESFDISPNGDRIAGATLDGRVLLWDTTTRDLLWVAELGNGEIVSVDFDPSGRTVLAAIEEGRAALLNAETGARDAWLEGHPEAIVAGSFGPKGRLILTYSGTQLLIWDRQDLEAGPLRYTGHREVIMDAAFAPDGRSVLTVSTDGSTRLWPVVFADTVQTQISDAASYCTY